MDFISNGNAAGEVLAPGWLTVRDVLIEHLPAISASEDNRMLFASLHLAREAHQDLSSRVFDGLAHMGLGGPTLSIASTELIENG